mgnify:CR=1 FL=1
MPLPAKKKVKKRVLKAGRLLWRVSDTTRAAKTSMPSRPSHSCKSVTERAWYVAISPGYVGYSQVTKMKFAALPSCPQSLTVS